MGGKTNVKTWLTMSVLLVGFLGLCNHAAAKTWTGAANNNWSNGNNWNPIGAPTPGDDVIIPDAATTSNYPLIDTTCYCKSITIESGGILNSGAHNILYVSGNWTNNGAFGAYSGTVVFDGTSTIVSGGTGAGAAFNNLRVSSGSCEVITHSLRVERKLTIDDGAILEINTGSLNLYTGEDSGAARGTVDVDIDGTLQLQLSSASGDIYWYVLKGSIVDIDAGATVIFDGFDDSNMVYLRSSADGSQWYLNDHTTSSGNPAVNYTDIMDSVASRWNTIYANDGTSVDSGNNLHWLFTPVIFVDTSAPGPTHDGTNWATAYKHLQDALDDAVADDEIWVAEGIYYPDANSANPGGTNEREATFGLINGVAIYGGFAGTESSPEQRDIELYETILSGDINTPGDANDNSYHVVTGGGTDANAVLDGFTITAGNANGGGMYNHGGGMFNYDDYYYYNSPTVVNCMFSGNSAGSAGGGMFNYEGSLTVVNCTFIGNSAESGGGMYNYDSNPTVVKTLVNCTFSGNSAGSAGGGVINWESNPALTNCTFSGNSADEYGGGMFNYIISYPTLTNCILWGNIDSGGMDESAQIHGGFSTVTYSCIQGLDSFAGNNNIGDDPIFVDPNGPDDIIGTEDDNLWLSPDSNCIDAANNNSVPADILDLDNDGNTVEPIPYDLDGNPRFADGDCNDTEIVDMGAYEYHPSIHVRAGASPGGDGTSWATAYKYLQDALVNPCLKSGYEIWVAEGIYYPDANSANPGGTNEREATFQLINGVALYGGFAGTESSPEQRDWKTNVTILSGDLNGDDVGFANNGDNSYHVVTGSGTDANAVLDGFTITGGNANSSSLPDNYGGGMLNYDYYDNSSPTVVNCTFIGNSAEYGGGMYNDYDDVYYFNSSLTVVNCTFSGNSAGSAGGGVLNWRSSPLLTNCTFSGNSAGSAGGGVYNWWSNTALTNCTFSGNSADEYGGGMYTGVMSYPTLTNTILWGNSDSGGTDESAQIDGNWPTTVMYSCIQGLDSFAGNNNIGDDPLFVRDPNHGGDGWGVGDNDDYGDLHIVPGFPGSPCIDAGDNCNNAAVSVGTDIDGDPRIVDGDSTPGAVVDMGADEVMWDGAENVSPEDDPVTLNPGGGSDDPNEEALVVFDNNSLADDANITVVEMSSDLHPPAGGFEGLGTTLRVDTTLDNGQFFMTVMIPFDTDDLAGEEPLTVDLMWWDGADWVLAVQGNIQNSPGKSGPVGDRDPNQAPAGPTLSNELGDYGVYWNLSAQKGFVWANVDHISDFVGLAHNVADLEPDGDVDFVDFAYFAKWWLDTDCGLCGRAELTGDGNVDGNDLHEFVENWLAGK